MDTPTHPDTLPPPLADGTLGSKLDRALAQTGEAAHQLTERAGDFAQRSGAQLRQRGQQLREQSAVQVHDHPLRSLALAAAAGVALTLIASWLMRR